MKLIFPLWDIPFLLVFSVKWLNLTSFSKNENLTVVNVQLGWKADALTVPEASGYCYYCRAGTVSAVRCSLSHGEGPRCSLCTVQTRSKNRRCRGNLQ